MSDDERPKMTDLKEGGGVVEYNKAQGEALGIRMHPGYLTPFSNRSASGAIPNGTRIRKTMVDDGDMNPLGATGVVLGSLRVPGKPGRRGIGYFVAWDARPHIAVFVTAMKIERA